MTEEKLNGLIISLLTMAETENLPHKYDSTISELLLAESAKNIIIYNHFDKPIVIFNNNAGGITVLGAKQANAVPEE